jgi:large subunit ribosomal protein L4
MNKKERRLALFTLLSSKARNNQVKVIENIALEDAKTKNMVAIMNNMNVAK